MLLPRNISECTRTPFSVKNLVQKIIPNIKNRERYLYHVACRRAVAHSADRLMLLGSPPDMVHGAPSHRTYTPHDKSNAPHGLLPYNYTILF